MFTYAYIHNLYLITRELFVIGYIHYLLDTNLDNDINNINLIYIYIYIYIYIDIDIRSNIMKFILIIVYT